MTKLIEDGWLWVDNGTDSMELAVKIIEHNIPRAPDIMHYNAGGSHGWDLGKKNVIIKVKGIMFETLADMETFQLKIDAWQSAGTIDVKVQVTEGGTYQKLDGTNTVYPCLHYGTEKGMKLGSGDNTIYEVGQMIFELAGTPSA